MKITDLYENKWDDFGREDFPDEYFADIDQNHPWMANDYSNRNGNFLMSFETASHSRSPYDFTSDLFSFSVEQLRQCLQVHGVDPGDIFSKFELIKLAVRNQKKIAAEVSATLRRQSLSN